MPSSYSLGRAFLQAAFIRVNWDQGLGKWYLAQAPGPSTASVPSRTIFKSTLTTSSSKWADTWNGIWTALPVASPNVSTSSPVPGLNPSSPAREHDHKNSAGAFAVIALVFALYWWRSSRVSPAITLQQPDKGLEEFKGAHEAPAPEPRELCTGQQIAWELSTSDQAVPRLAELQQHSLI